MLNCLHPLLLNVFVGKFFPGPDHRVGAFNRCATHNGHLDFGFNDVIFMSCVRAEYLIHLLKGFAPEDRR